MEATGGAQIQILSIVELEPPIGTLSSPALAEFLFEEDRLEKSKELCIKALQSLGGPLGSHGALASKLRQTLGVSEFSRDVLYAKLEEIEAQLGEVNKALDDEQSALLGPHGDPQLRTRVEFTIFAAAAPGGIEFYVTYGGSRLSSATPPIIVSQI